MGRHYKHKGKELPSVTTILADCSNNSGALIQWGANSAVEWIRENCDLSDFEIESGLVSGLLFEFELFMIHHLPFLGVQFLPNGPNFSIYLLL